MVITNDKALAEKVRYISTTPSESTVGSSSTPKSATTPPSNVNAALGCAQMEYFDRIIDTKRETAARYKDFFDSIGRHSLSNRGSLFELLAQRDAVRGSGGARGFSRVLQ